MNRVLSGQASRCIETSQEFVSKRLCISFVIIFAFFSMIGGFFLGRYASGSVKKIVEENRFDDASRQLALTANKINNLTLELSVYNTKTATFDYSALYSQTLCQRNCKLTTHDNGTFKENFSAQVRETVLKEITSLNSCFNNVTEYLESELNLLKNINS